MTGGEPTLGKCKARRVTCALKEARDQTHDRMNKNVPGGRERAMSVQVNTKSDFYPRRHL